MDKISIFNYEAFYLDFLEGNLSEVDTALFLEFLEENPDLKMENELLPTLEVNEAIMCTDDKDELKHPEETEELCLKNIEYFLIAQAEGELSLEKSMELDLFISGNPELAHTEKLIKSVYFEADMSVLFTDKESLKRKKKIVLWPYYTVAASILVALLVWYSNSPGKPSNTKQLFAKDQVEESLKNQEIKTPNRIGSDEEDSLDQQSVRPEYNQNIEGKNQQVANNLREDREEQSEFKNLKNDLKEEESTPENIANNNHKPRVNSIENIKLEPVSNSPALIAKVDPNLGVEEEYADKYFSDVENPIEPITSFIGNKTNTKIDFRREKKTKNKPSKLFIKVGKFEFSRKKH